jgi:hypothetical protein
MHTTVLWYWWGVEQGKGEDDEVVQFQKCTKTMMKLYKYVSTSNK